MTTYLLTQRACDHDLPPKRTVTAACIHTDDDFVRFHDAKHGLVYAVQRGLLLAIETLPDESNPDQDAEPEQTPDPVTYVTLEADTSGVEAAIRRGLGTTPNRWLLMRQFGWSMQQANELPDWLAAWLLEAH